MSADAHVKPPEDLRHLFKKYQKASTLAIDQDNEVVDFARGLTDQQKPAFPRRTWMARGILQEACEHFALSQKSGIIKNFGDIECYESRDIPVPDLVPLQVQTTLLDKVLHRDLNSPEHKTNVHFHHSIAYPKHALSFFDLDKTSTSYFSPCDSSIHKPLTVQQFLDKRLRWITLGGQYDWTEKRYPDEQPPDFPADIQQLLHALFPRTTAEAAIVNLYSPNDVLSLHRDVSEFCDQGLISVSVGCDGLFMIALGNETDLQNPLPQAVLRLHSGDAVYMTGASRYAWHGVPRILPDTCPPQLQAWPCSTLEDLDGRGFSNSERFSQWRNWLAGKRINLNVRQMFDQAKETNGH